MKRSPILLLFVASALLFTISCKHHEMAGILVPKDAVVALHINTQSLSSKLSWAEIKKSEWFREAYDKADDSLLKNLMEDPANSGINTAAGMMFFVEKAGRGGYFVLQGTLQDPAAFQAVVKKISPETEVTKDGELSIVKAGGDGGVITWNPLHFVYAADASFLNAGKRFGMRHDYNLQPGVDHFPADSLVKFAKAVYDIKGDQSLGSDSRFADMMKENGDLHLWMNSGGLYSDILGGALSMIRLSTLLENNVSASTLNFDNGKIEWKSKHYYNKELTDFIKDYKSRKVSAELVNRIPSQNVYGVMAMSYSPQGLKDFLKLMGVDGLINGFLGEKMNYSLDEFIKANKGDVLVALSDLDVKTNTETTPDPSGGQPYTNTQTSTDTKALFAVSIGDKAAFDKLVGSVKGLMTELPQPKELSEFTYSMNNDWFVAGNSQQQVDEFMKGGDHHQPFADKISGHSFGLYVDLQKVLHGSSGLMRDSSAKAAMDASAGMWQDILFTGGDFSSADEAVSSTAVIDLVDKNTNSLQQLNRYFDQLAATRKQGF